MKRATFTSPPFGSQDRRPKGRRPPLQQPGGNPSWRANPFVSWSKRGRPLPTQKGYGANPTRSPSAQVRGSKFAETRLVDRPSNFPPRKSQRYTAPPSYADVVRKGQPSRSLQNFPPKPKPKLWQDRTQKPNASFWQAAQNSQKEWIHKQPHWSVVQWVLGARQR